MSRREALLRLGAAGALVAAASAGLPLPAEVASKAASLHIPCDGCGHCEPCPYGVAIVKCFGTYNAALDADRLPDPRRSHTGRYRRQSRAFLAAYRNGIGQFERADRCIGCGKCEERCPKRLPVVAYLRQIEMLTERLETDELKP